MAIIKNCLRYSSGFLRRIGSLVKSVSNYDSFHIDTPVRAWIIALGIRSSPVKFRRGRTGKNLFYHIATTTHRQHHEANYRRACRPLQAVNWNNLLLIKMRNNSWQSQSILAHQDDLHGALINCRSVINKTQEIQLELIRNNLDLCILTETWIKESDTVDPTRLCPNGYKSFSISRQDKVGGGVAINIAVNEPSDARLATFLDVLDSFNLVNKVDKPTHRLANTLDLIILDANSSTIPRVKVDQLFSDHNIILFDMALPHTITSKSKSLQEA